MLIVLTLAVVTTRLLAPRGEMANSERFLIFHQQTEVPPNRTSPAYVAAHIAEIEALPFDGITVDIPASLTLMRGKPIPYTEMYDQGLGLLKDRFTRMKQNFVMVYNDKPGDVFDDRAWAVTVENWRNLARAARDAGFEGIFFDNEAYREQWFNFPEDYRNPSHSLQQYEDETTLRGQEIMEAMVAEFPAIKVLIFHGPYVSEPKTPDIVRKNQAGFAWENELLGPFFVGFIQGAGAQARVIDGGEVFQYRTPDDFQQSYEWRKFGMASGETDCAFIPPSLRASWPDRVSIGFGVSTRPYASTPMNPSIMQDTLPNALNRADAYVWLYTEDHHWLTPGGMPREWIDAIRRGVNAAQSSEKGVSAAAKPRVKHHSHTDRSRQSRHSKRHHRQEKSHEAC